MIGPLDFKTPMNLVKYLEKLSQDDALYASYFWWKDYYEIRDGPEDRAQSYCDLCERLNNPEEPPKIYTDMHKWWIKDSNCFVYEYLIQSWNYSDELIGF